MTYRITFPSNTVGRPNSIQSYAVNLPFRLNQRRHVNGKRVNNSASKKRRRKRNDEKVMRDVPDLSAPQFDYRMSSLLGVAVR